MEPQDDPAYRRCRAEEARLEPAGLRDLPGRKLMLTAAAYEAMATHLEALQAHG